MSTYMQITEIMWEFGALYSERLALFLNACPLGLCARSWLASNPANHVILRWCSQHTTTYKSRDPLVIHFLKNKKKNSFSFLKIKKKLTKEQEEGEKNNLDYTPPSFSVCVSCQESERVRGAFVSLSLQVVSESLFPIRSNRQCTPSKSLLGSLYSPLPGSADGLTGSVVADEHGLVFTGQTNTAFNL